MTLQPAVVLLAVVVSVAAAVKGQPAGSVQPLTVGDTFTIQSSILKETRRINVYKPPVSEGQMNAPLPVLYMTDGGMAEDFLHVAGLLQVSVGNGTVRPFLLVGIENTERRRDMTGPTEIADDRKIAARVGGSAAFRRFIRQELMPAVKARHQVTDEEAIVGESLAGLFVVDTLLLEPDLFDIYMAFDPSLWWNAQHLVKSAPERVRALAGRPLRVFLASSREPELAKLTTAFADTLRTHAPGSLQWEHLSMPQETHATIYHPAALAAFRKVLRTP
jgi:predicted alpha/beta superfamily hydrolase